MRIVLDPGHGGDQPGAVYAGVQEKDVTLDVVLHAGRLLRDAGHQVLFTRDRDENVSLTQRRNMINEFRPDAFISIHCNADPNHRSSGVEGYYRDDRDYPLANMVQQAVAAYTGMHDRGISQDVAALHKHLTVLDDSDSVPATLVELGFLDNDGDRLYLMQNIMTVSEAVADGIHEYGRQKGLIT